MCLWDGYHLPTHGWERTSNPRIPITQIKILSVLVVLNRGSCFLGIWDFGKIQSLVTATSFFSNRLHIINPQFFSFYSLKASLIKWFLQWFWVILIRLSWISEIWQGLYSNSSQSIILLGGISRILFKKTFRGSRTVTLLCCGIVAFICSDIAIWNSNFIII